MRVLHVVTSGELGGAQVHIAALVSELVRAGVDVEVACGPGEYLPGALASIARVFLIPSLRSAPSPAADARSFGALLGLARGRDAVHTHSAKAGVLGRLAARVRGVPRIVHTSHGSFLAEPRSRAALRVLLAAERAAAAVTTHLFVLSLADLELMRAHGLYRSTPAEFIRVVPGRVARPSGVWSRGTGRHSVVAVANLYRNKGLDVLLRSMALVRRSVPEASVTVLGEGPERAALERIARADGITASLPGSVPDPSLVLLDAGVFVLPSRKEGLPIALLEALALGVPCVTTRIGAIPELVGEDEAEMVPSEDPDALATAIIRVLRDSTRAEALSEGGRRAVARFISLSSIAPILSAYTSPP